MARPKLVDLRDILYFEEFKASIEARIENHSLLPDERGCRLWTGGKRQGYGHMTYVCRKAGGIKVSGDTSPHKLAYMVANRDLQHSVH